MSIFGNNDDDSETIEIEAEDETDKVSSKEPESREVSKRNSETPKQTHSAEATLQTVVLSAKPYQPLELTSEDCNAVTTPEAAKILQNDLQVMNVNLSMVLAAFKASSSVYDILEIAKVSSLLLKERRLLLTNLPQKQNALPSVPKPSPGYIREAVRA